MKIDLKALERPASYPRLARIGRAALGFAMFGRGLDGLTTALAVNLSNGALAEGNPLAKSIAVNNDISAVVVVSVWALCLVSSTFLILKASQYYKGKGRATLLFAAIAMGLLFGATGLVAGFSNIGHIISFLIGATVTKGASA